MHSFESSTVHSYRRLGVVERYIGPKVMELALGLLSTGISMLQEYCDPVVASDVARCLD